MKKISLILIIYLLVLNKSVAQNILEKSYDTKNIHLIETTNYIAIPHIFATPYTQFRITKIEGEYSFDLKIQMEDSLYTCFSSLSYLMFWFKDGSSLKLSLLLLDPRIASCPLDYKESADAFDQDHIHTYWTIKLSYDLNVENLDKITGNEITKLKVYGDKQEFDFKLNKYKSSDIHTAINLVK